MKVYFPSYYNNFSCIADRCRHSCCVGWEISVDAETLDKYERLGREDILCHISDGSIVLRCDMSCPFLTECGLCRIISDLGENFTSVICREHPRFYHRVGNRIEGGIGASCEEAARIILTSDNYSEFLEICRERCDVADETEFDTLTYRAKIYDVLLDNSLSYREKMAKIRNTYALPEALHTDDEWQEVISELEIMNEEHRKMFSFNKHTSSLENNVYFERFFAYLIFRHASIAENYDNLRARVGFCLLLTEFLECCTSSSETKECEIIEIARVISEEIEYSEDNTATLILEIESLI